MNDYIDLQLFAEEAPAAPEGATESAQQEPGVDAAVAGQEELAALGVPQENIRKTTAAAVGRQKIASAQVDQTPKPAPERQTWKQIMADPEYNAAAQKMMQDRLRHVPERQEMEALKPVLQMLAGRYGLEPGENGRYDMAALAKATMEDDSLYEEKAAELGVAPSTARRIEQMEAAEREQAAQREYDIRMESYRNHYQKLEAEAAQLKERMPDFDLQHELETNETFKRLTSPGVGLTVEQAFNALYGQQAYEQGVQAAHKEAAEALAADMQTNRSRPREIGAQQHGGMTPASIANMTRAERDALNARIYAGEIIVP